MKRAEKIDWKNESLSSLRTTISLDRIFTQNEMDHITTGMIPEEMEDKWFIYWEGDSLYFHRSWTGMCIYVVRFHQEDTFYRVNEADINRNSEEYTEADDQKDIEKINYLIDRLLLKHNAALPSDSNVLENWSFVGRAMMEDKEHD